MDEDWEWMIQSLKKYKHLYNFELSEPTHVLEWAGEDEIFVADASSQNDRFEMLILSLPTKLRAAPNEQGKLSKDRDFKMVAGGFHNQPFHAMAMVSDRHYLSCNRLAPYDVLLWEIRGDEDVIVKQKDYQGQGSKGDSGQVPIIAANPEEVLQAARGTTIGDVELLDLETGKALWTCNRGDDLVQPLASIDFVSSRTLLLCDASNGRLHSIDTRVQDPNIPEVPDPSMVPIVDRWNCAVNFLSRHYKMSENLTKADGKHLAAAISSYGCVHIYDLRDLSRPVHSVRVADGRAAAHPPCVRWSAGGNLLSVSGWDNCVRIYDISLFRDEPDTLAEPIFTYDGHVANEDEGDSLWVTNHLWHGESPRLVLSAASDGSLHAWDWLPT